jgi:hypothetical protein
LISLHKVEYALQYVVNLTNLHCMEVVGLRQVAHNTGTMSKHVESSPNMVRQMIGMGCRRIGIADRSI